MRRLLGYLLLSAAVLQLGFRGMQRVRDEVPLWDFASVYAASRTWIHAGNPYDLPGVLTTWHQAGIFSDRGVSYFATVYPPNSLCMLVPFAVLPAGAAMVGWLAITLILLCLQFAALSDLAGFTRRDPRVLVLVAASLASAPFQFGILSGQLSLPAISICIMALWCATRDRSRLAGVLLGIACAIKPQVAAPLVLYYLLLRRWSVSGLALAASGSVLALALAAMHLSHIDWFHGWTQSIAATSQIGGVNDYGWAGDYRDEIMDLKMLFVSLFHDPMALRIMLLSTVAALALCYLNLFRRWTARNDRDQLLMLGGLAAISFLPVYHRVYDATLLTVVLAWALAELDGPRRRHAVALLIPMALFLIPFDFAQAAGRRLRILATVSRTGWWQTLIAPHYALALFTLVIVILVTINRLLIHSATPSAAISPAEQQFPTPQGS